MTTRHPSLAMRATEVREQLFQAGKMLDQISDSLGSLKYEQTEYEQFVLANELNTRNERLAQINAQIAAAENMAHPTMTQLRARALIDHDTPDLAGGTDVSDFDELADVISLRSLDNTDLSEEDREFEQRFSDFASGDVDDASRRWFTGT